jgi:serine protease AprX
VAPDARLVSVKVGAASGAVDVSQVIAAIDWVVAHRHDDGLNIRVLNLSYGTDGVQDYLLDPLTYAVEVAWRKGIVVVVAAGNNGPEATRLDNPAYDPRVLAVGASDPVATAGTKDDLVADFSSRGNPTRGPTWSPRASRSWGCATPGPMSTWSTPSRWWPTGSLGAAAPARLPRSPPGRSRCCCSSAPP